jgi:hypothetical protein
MGDADQRERALDFSFPYFAGPNVYAKTKPTAAPVIDHFVDVSPSECSTKAPASILALHVDGPVSFDNADTLKLVRERCSWLAFACRRSSTAFSTGGMYPAIGGTELLVRAADVGKANNALHRRHHRSE